MERGFRQQHLLLLTLLLLLLLLPLQQQCNLSKQFTAFTAGPVFEILSGVPKIG